MEFFILLKEVWLFYYVFEIFWMIVLIVFFLLYFFSVVLYFLLFWFNFLIYFIRDFIFIFFLYNMEVYFCFLKDFVFNIWFLWFVNFDNGIKIIGFCNVKNLKIVLEFVCEIIKFVIVNIFGSFLCIYLNCLYFFLFCKFLLRLFFL